MPPNFIPFLKFKLSKILANDTVVKNLTSSNNYFNTCISMKIGIDTYNSNTVVWDPLIGQTEIQLMLTNQYYKNDIVIYIANDLEMTISLLALKLINVCVGSLTQQINISQIYKLKDLFAVTFSNNSGYSVESFSDKYKQICPIQNCEKGNILGDFEECLRHDETIKPAEYSVNINGQFVLTDIKRTLKTNQVHKFQSEGKNYYFLLIPHTDQIYKEIEIRSQISFINSTDFSLSIILTKGKIELPLTKSKVISIQHKHITELVCFKHAHSQGTNISFDTLINWRGFYEYKIGVFQFNISRKKLSEKFVEFNIEPVCTIKNLLPFEILAQCEPEQITLKPQDSYDYFIQSKQVIFTIQKHQSKAVMINEFSPDIPKIIKLKNKDFKTKLLVFGCLNANELSIYAEAYIENCTNKAFELFGGTSPKDFIGDLSSIKPMIIVPCKYNALYIGCISNKKLKLTQKFSINKNLNYEKRLSLHHPSLDLEVIMEATLVHAIKNVREQHITIYPAYWIIPSSDMQLLVDDNIITLLKNNNYPLHSQKTKIKIRDDIDCEWSQVFEIEEAFTDVIIDTNKAGKQISYLVSKAIQKGVIKITINKLGNIFLNKISNETDCQILFQLPLSKQIHYCPPNCIYQYNLKEGTKEQNIQFIIFYQALSTSCKPIVVDIAKSSSYIINDVYCESNLHKFVEISFTQKGVHKIISIKNVQILEASSRELHCAGIGISVLGTINEEIEELMYVKLCSIMMKAEEDKKGFRSYALEIKNIQIDNNISTQQKYPLILFTERTLNLSVEKSKAVYKKFINFSLVKKEDRIKYLGFLIQPFCVRMNSEILSHYLTYYHNLSSIFKMQDSATKEEVTISDEESLFFEKFELSPVELNLSFEEKVNTTQKSKNIGMSIISTTFKNISRAPIKLNALIMDGFSCKGNEIYTIILSHYKSKLFVTALTLIGASEFIGNPINIAKSLKKGVQDLFYKPAEGNNPTDIIKGIGKGTYSLLSSGVNVTFGTAGAITSTLAKSLLTIVDDVDYNRSREENKANRGNALEGMSTGLIGFGKSIVSGIKGIIERPIEGAERDGAKGFFIGVGQGLAGIVVKPVSGAFDFISDTAEGIKNTFVSENELKIPKAKGIILP